MIEFLLELLAEVFFQALGEVIVELGWESIAHALGRKRRTHPILAILGWAIIGAACGALSALVFPQRVLPWRKTPGISLVLAPLLTGAFMRIYGDRRRQAGKSTTALATFWGGAAFAFALSAIRLWLIRSN